MVKWIEQAAPGSTAEPEHPAPLLPLRAQPGSPSDVQRVKIENTSNTGSVTLSIIALVVAAGALGYAVVTRARSRP
jgi:uncharacterized protein